MAKKEDLENIENQLSTEDKYQLAKECIEKEDYENAILYLEQLAKVDYALAEFTLANLYLAGLGVAKDEKKAAYYFELAAMLEYVCQEIIVKLSIGIVKQRNKIILMQPNPLRTAIIAVKELFKILKKR